jgi:general bacterial porin, GBP family
MKKSLIALAGLAAIAAAHAEDSNVQLYGVLDAGVGHVAHSLAADPNYAATINPWITVKTSVPSGVTAMFNGGAQGSRWGIRGSEDLGNGTSAIFTLESGIIVGDGNLTNTAAALASNSPTPTTVSATSSLNGQLFSRQAWVGLSDKTLGTVTLGRNYAPEYYIVSDFDPVFTSMFSPFGNSGIIGGGGGVSEDTRVDNSVAYKNKVGDVNFGGLYKFGGVSGNSNAQSGMALSGGYESGPVGIQVAYEKFVDAVKGSTGTVANQVKLSIYNTSSYLIGAKYKFGSGSLKAGFETYTLSTPSDLTGSYTYYGQTVQSASPGIAAGGASQTTHVMWIGGDYDVSSALNVALGYYDNKLLASPTQGGVTGQKSGDIYSLSLMADYKFSKLCDVYAGTIFTQYKGNNYATGYYTSNSMFGAGLRVKF